MGIRETLNKNPQITTGITALIIVVTLIFIIKAVWFSDDNGSGGGGPIKRYYTTDISSPDAAKNAKFLDEPRRFPPFKNAKGQTCYGIEIYSCDNGKTEQVAYVWEYPKEYRDRAEKQMTDAEAAKKAGKPVGIDTTFDPVVQQEIYDFGTKTWLTGDKARKGIDAVQYKCGPEQRSVYPYQQ